MPNNDAPEMVGDYVKLVRGSTYKGDLVGKPGPPLLGLGSIEAGGGFRIGKFKTFGGECPPKWMVPPGSLYVALKGATKDGSMVGSVARLPVDLPAGRLTQDTARLDFFDARPETANYLYWILRTPQYRAYCDGRVTGSASASFSRDDFLSFPVPAVTDAAMAIVETLEAAEQKIEQNRRTGSKLEGLARAVFKAWFVDFEPVKAKAAGATAFPGMPPETFATLPTRLTDSEIGPVPEGWEVKPIGDVVTVRGGGTPSTKDDSFWTGGTQYWATPKDLSSLQHRILLSTERRITDAGVAKISSGVLPVNTVLLSSRAPVGYLALAKVPTAVNQGFIAIECTGPLKPHFMLQWLNARMDDIKGRASGTTFAEISKSAFRQIPAAVPIPAMASAFEDAAKPLFDIITHLVAESAKLASLRDYLLPRLLSGRVRVGERMSPRQLTSSRP